jgi:hypothetical protein
MFVFRQFGRKKNILKQEILVQFRNNANFSSSNECHIEMNE